MNGFRKENNGNFLAVLYALAAAAFYALNVPCSKYLLSHVPPVFMAGLLYIGAGLGVGCMYLFRYKKEFPESRLSKADKPYTVGMVALDILAPILLMLGVKIGSSAEASLLGNFEIVATTCIAFWIFRENVSWRLWTAIFFITVSSMILSLETVEGFSLSFGALLVLGATVCWGFENNCTRRISGKSTYQIVTVKGLCSGAGALAVSAVVGEGMPEWAYVLPALLLGFVAYGLSIFTYVRAQNVLGAAKTSAYYAVAPFIGAFLAFAFLGESLSVQYLVALLVMIVGTVFVIYDTLLQHHSHEHTHTFVHTHDGSTHSHTVVHTHGHDHFVTDSRHGHHHSQAELEKMLSAPHHGV